MTMRNSHISIFTSLLIVSASGCSGATSLPSRGDCIVHVSGKSPGALARISNDPDMLVETARKLAIPVGGVAYSSSGDVYLQFSERCETRGEMARHLVEAIVGPGADGLIYQASGIAPGAETIDVIGPAWKEERAVPFVGK